MFLMLFQLYDYLVTFFFALKINKLIVLMSFNLTLNELNCFTYVEGFDQATNYLSTDSHFVFLI